MPDSPPLSPNTNGVDRPYPVDGLYQSRIGNSAIAPSDSILLSAAKQKSLEPKLGRQD
jgi:hypothetical protein